MNEKKSKEVQDDVKSNVNSNKFVIILLIITIVVILCIAGVIGFFLINSGALNNKTTNTTNSVTNQTVSITEKKFELDEFVVNLADENRTYLKIKLVLAYVTPETSAELTSKIYEVRHAINMTMMSKKSIDLNEKSLPKVITELIEKINNILIKGKITNIYINNILIS